MLRHNNPLSDSLAQFSVSIRLAGYSLTLVTTLSHNASARNGNLQGSEVRYVIVRKITNMLRKYLYLCVMKTAKIL